MASYSKRYKKDPVTGEIMIDPKTKKEIIIGWRLQDIINGQRKEFTGKTKKEAELKRDLYKEDLQKYGSVLSKQNYTISEMVYNYLFTVKINEVAHSTFELLTNLYNKNIKNSTIAEIQISDTTQSTIQEFLNKLGETYSYSYVRQHYLLLLASFEYGIKNNLLRVNPAKGISLPKQNNKITKTNDCFTLEEQKSYIKALKDEKYELVMLTALFTGLRKSEIISLKWGCVDTEQKIIRVIEITQTVKVYTNTGSYKKETITKPPKSKAGFRNVPIPDFLNNLLVKHKPKNCSDDSFVFLTSKNTPLTPRNILFYHKRACERAKIRPTTVDGKTTYKGITFHGLRHTYITRLIEAGENIRKVQELAGHADIETTLQIYTHVMKDSVKMSAIKQDKLYKSLL